jgi:glycerol-3-phosphate acyltransferase PlsX
MITLAVDCMGGRPRSPRHSCGLPPFLDAHPDARLLLVGQEAPCWRFAHTRARIVVATEVVCMDDPWKWPCARKKDSSMRIAIQQVKDGAAQAAVSAGNTGALMAIARYLLKTLDGIDRRPLPPSCPMPRAVPPRCWISGPMSIAAEHLLQFAVMGSALVSVLNEDEATRLSDC